MSRGGGEEKTDIVEMEAMDVDEWDRDRHTPRAHDKNIAELLKQSTATEAPPPTPATAKRMTAATTPRVTKAAPAQASPVAKPADARRVVDPPAKPAPRRTQALPIARAADPKPAAAQSKPATSAAQSKPATAQSKPATTPAAAKPATAPAQPAAAAKPGTAPAQPAAAKPATAPAQPAAAKPATTPAKAESRPAVTPAKPSAESKAALAKLATTPTDPKPAKAAEPPMRLSEPALLPPPPQRAPTTDEEWEPKTSVGNVMQGGEPPVAAAPPQPFAAAITPMPQSEFGSDDDRWREPSVIIDLGSKKPREPAAKQRALTPVVLQTSEQNAIASGAFVMPTAEAPNAQPPRPQTQPVTPKQPASANAQPIQPLAKVDWDAAPVLPPPPLAFAPMPQQSAPPLLAPSTDDSIPHVEETDHRIARRSVLATVLPTPRAKRVALIGGGACVVIVLAIVFASGGKSSSHAAPVTSAPAPVAKPAPIPELPPVAAKPAVVAVADPAPAATPPPTTQTTTTTTTPGPTPAQKPARKRIARAKKPVVVDYDKQKPDAPEANDTTLAQARADYAAGNQHLFAGETDAAISAYREALAAYPNYVAGYRGLGLAFAQQGNRGEALKAFKTYVKLAPTAKDFALIQKRITRLSGP